MKERAKALLSKNKNELSVARTFYVSLDRADNVIEGGPSFREVAKGWGLVLSAGSQEPHPCEERKDAAPKIQNYSETRTASLGTKNGRIVSYVWDATGG
jgi:hypothetical protein